MSHAMRARSQAMIRIDVNDSAVQATLRTHKSVC